MKRTKQSTFYRRELATHEREKKARLIAAAPELLEALQAIREQISEDGSVTNKFNDDEIEALDTLIAKAEGRA
jgi:hypothetical protein